jgi:hypothetical protein
MFAEPFEGKDGYRIWLDLEESDELLAAADSREERVRAGRSVGPACAGDR